MAAICSDGDHVADHQQRQQGTGRLTSRELTGEDHDGQRGQAADRGLGNTDHEGGKDEQQPCRETQFGYQHCSNSMPPRSLRTGIGSVTCRPLTTRDTVTDACTGNGAGHFLGSRKENETPNERPAVNTVLPSLVWTSPHAAVPIDWPVSRQPTGTTGVTLRTTTDSLLRLTTPKVTVRWRRWSVCVHAL